jgi:glycosyltransferase involved in cell wall biosynthesis
MKIVHLNTHAYGGAAVVARRLHEAALAEGVDSRYVTMFGVASDGIPAHTPLKNARLLYALRKKTANPYAYKIGKYIQRRFEHKNLANRPPGFEIFSPLNTDNGFADCTAAFDPDVIHLHWVAGFVDHRTFFQRNRHKKFVWTLHDMNPFTGGCHYDYGCGNFKVECGACPQLEGTIDWNYAQRVLAAKRDALAELADHQLVVVAPSQWLLDLSQQSQVTSRFRHVRIDNPSFGLSPTICQTDDLKQRLKVPRDRKVVVFIADNLRNPRKGVDVLIAAASMMRDKESVHFVGLGQATTAPADVSISFPGAVQSDDELAQYLHIADLLVSPSIAENSPLTVIEALTCGTPVLSFAVGGVPELINDQNGEIVPERTPEALAEALHRMLFGRSYDRRAIQSTAARNAPAVVVRRYRSLYAELLEERE